MILKKSNIKIKYYFKRYINFITIYIDYFYAAKYTSNLNFIKNVNYVEI